MPILEGKTALITGGGRGIGRAIALAFAREGARVAICSRTKAELGATAQAIQATGGRCLARRCDVTDEGQVAALIHDVEQQFGALHVLVNNAGGHVQLASVRESSTAVRESTTAEWWRTVEINLLGTYLVTRLALPLLERSAPSKIINLGSGMGREARPGKSQYNAAKAAVWMFTMCLAQEVWELGIDVNELIPGPVLRDGEEAAGAPPYAPSERVKPPEEVTALALWLATRPVGGPTGQTFSLARRPL